MATKTIRLELDAYEKLRRARRSPRESFSSVVRRARWDEPGATGPEVLAALDALVEDHPEVLLSEEVLSRIEARAIDRPVRASIPR
jgi:hypothetical protein